MPAYSLAIEPADSSIGIVCSALSGDVAWEEVGAYSAIAEIITMLDSAQSVADGTERRNRSAGLVADACAAFPRDNADAKARDVEVGADLQRIRARSKAMLVAAGLALPPLQSAQSPRAGGEGGALQGPASPAADAGEPSVALGASVQPPRPEAARAVPIAGAFAASLQF